MDKGKYKEDKPEPVQNVPQLIPIQKPKQRAHLKKVLKN